MVFIVGMLFFSSFCCASENVSLSVDGTIIFNIERGKNKDPWQRSIDANSFDKNLFVMHEDLGSALFSGPITISYDRDDTIDYTDPQGLDDVLKVIGNFGYNTQTSTVTGNKQIYDMSTLEKALEKTKQYYVSSTAKTVQQSLLWAQKLQLQESFSNVLVDVYVDALLKTDFIKNARDARYYLPLTVDLDKKVAKILVRQILKTDFSDQSKNYSLQEWHGNFDRSFKKVLIKKNDKEVILFFSFDGATSQLSTPLSGSPEQWCIFDAEHISDACWVKKQTYKWDWASRMLYISDYIYDDKHIITVGADGFVRLYDAKFIINLGTYQVQQKDAIQVKEFNSDVSDLKTVHNQHDVQLKYQLSDASVIADASGLMYLGLGNALYKMRVQGDKLSIETATIVSDNPAQISGLFLKNDTIVVTYKNQPSKNVFWQWRDLEEKYAYYKIVGNQFSPYGDNPAGFETLNVTWRIPISDKDKVDKRKSFLIPHDDKLISVKDVFIARGLNECDNCYDVTFDDEFQQLLMLTKDQTSYAGPLLFVRKYDVIPLQLMSFIHALNEKTKNIKQDQVIVGESLTYDALLYIHNHHKHLAPALRISPKFKPIIKKIQSLVSSNPISNFYRYVRNSYFALGGHKKREFQIYGVLLTGVTLGAILAALRAWKGIQVPQVDRYGMPIDTDGFSWWKYFSKQ